MSSLSSPAQKIINDYLSLPFEGHSIACPYLNNLRVGRRASHRALIGKGTPQEIVEEANALAIQKRVKLSQLTDEELRRMLVDNRIGVDCSGFVYHVLDAEASERFNTPLKKCLKWSGGFIRNTISQLRPAQNTDVKTLLSEANSREISLDKINAGDFLTFTGNNISGGIRNHIILFHHIERDSGDVTRIHYVHSFSWPSDGTYGHGVRKGEIKVTEPKTSITSQQWQENESTDRENHTLQCLNTAESHSIRRLKSFDS